MRLSRRDAVDVAFVLALFAFVVVASLLRVEFGVTMRSYDGWWYLSRAWQHTHGIFDNLSFYTLAYPLLVGAINWFVYDLPVSGIIANAIILLFMAFGVYLIGRLFFSRAVALSSVFIFMLNGQLLYHVRAFTADLFFMAAVVWMVIAATLLVRTARRVWLLVLAALVSVSPYIRFESFIYGLLVIVLTMIAHVKIHDFKATLVIYCVIALSWIAYIMWFFSGADNLAVVGIVYTQPVDRLKSWLQSVALTYQPLDWAVIFTNFLGLSSFIVSRLGRGKHSLVSAILPLLMLSIPIAIVPAYVTLAAPASDYRFSLHVLPCLSVIYGVAIARLYGSKISAVTAIVTLIAYAFTALETIKDLPSPMSFQDHALAVAAKRASADVHLWKQRNGYQSATIRTMCTNLMVFAQFDLRLPFTRLAFSSQDSSPPERVLPGMMERGELLLVCPVSEIPLRNIERWSPWIELYEYLNAAPALGENDPLEEIGRIGAYRIYRVKPEVAGWRPLAKG